MELETHSEKPLIYLQTKSEELQAHYLLYRTFLERNNLVTLFAILFIVYMYLICTLRSQNSMF